MHWSSPGLWEMQSEESRVEPGIKVCPMSGKRKTKDIVKERNVMTFVDTLSKLLIE